MERYRSIDQIEITDVCKYDEKLYAFNISTQDLVFLSINEGIVRVVKHFGFNPGRLIFRVFEFNGEMLLFDKISLNIVIYNIENDTTEMMGSGMKCDFSDFIRYEDRIYMFPVSFTDSAYVFELSKKNIREIDLSLSMDGYGKGENAPYLCKKGNMVYAPVLGKNYIRTIALDKEKNDGTIELDTNMRICSCDVSSDAIYATCVNSTSLYRIGLYGKVEELYKGIEVFKPYSYLKIYGDFIITLPGAGGYVALYNLKKNSISALQVIEGDGRDGSKSIGMYYDEKGSIIILPYRMRELLKVDFLQSTIQTQDLKYDIVDLMREKEDICNGLLNEISEQDLNDFLVYVTHK